MTCACLARPASSQRRQRGQTRSGLRRAACALPAAPAGYSGVGEGDHYPGTLLDPGWLAGSSLPRATPPPRAVGTQPRKRRLCSAWGLLTAAQRAVGTRAGSLRNCRTANVLHGQSAAKINPLPAPSPKPATTTTKKKTQREKEKLYFSSTTALWTQLAYTQTGINAMIKSKKLDNWDLTGL